MVLNGTVNVWIESAYNCIIYIMKNDSMILLLHWIDKNFPFLLKMAILVGWAIKMHTKLSSCIVSASSMNSSMDREKKKLNKIVEETFFKSFLSPCVYYILPNDSNINV